MCSLAYGQVTDCAVWIDTLWLSEETLCDTRNEVDICYRLCSNCPDTTFVVYIDMSADSGGNWVAPGEGWFSTLLETSAVLGVVDTGVHCFYWEMNADTVHEGYDWLLRLRVYINYFCADSVIWNLTDSIYFGSGRGQDATVTESTIIIAADGIVPYDTAICLFEYDRCTGNLIRCDTIETDAFETSQGLTYAFGYLWVTGHDGAIFQLDPSSWAILGKYFIRGFSYFEGLTHDDSLLYVIDDAANVICGFYPDSFAAPGTLATATVILLSESHNYEGITLAGGRFWVAAWSGVYVFSYSDLLSVLDTVYTHPLPLIPHGLCFTGCYLFITSYLSHIVYIYGPGSYGESWLCPVADTAFAPLDSRPPDVCASCSTGVPFIMVGDTLSLSWTVDDLFWRSAPCSVHVYGTGCLYDTIIVVDNTMLDWVAPAEVSECDSIWFVVAAHDSFCNCGYDSCAFPVARPPQAHLLTPPRDAIIACDDQEIYFSVYIDPLCSSVDSEGTYLIIDQTDSFSLASPWLSLDTLLRLTPDSGYWTTGTHCFHLHLVDGCGYSLDSFYTAEFDFIPPTASMTSPPIGEPNGASGEIPDDGLTFDLYQDIEISFSDNLAGVDTSTVSLWLNDLEIPAEFMDICADKLYVMPESFGLTFSPGETVLVRLHLCDSPDLCDPNCANYSWLFALPPIIGCARIPNPFTPNGDGINDLCYFSAPGFGYEEGTIYIYDLHGVLLRSIDVPAGFGWKGFAAWDGRDSTGNDVPEGLYLYIVEVGGEIVCEGTVALAR